MKKISKLLLTFLLTLCLSNFTIQPCPNTSEEYNTDISAYSDILPPTAD